MTWWVCTQKSDGDEHFVMADGKRDLNSQGYWPRDWDRYDSGLDELPEYPVSDGKTIVSRPPSPIEETLRFGRRDVLAMKVIMKLNRRITALEKRLKAVDGQDAEE